MAAMDKVGLLFVEKAVAKRLVGKQEAETIFSNIRKSGRYLFNKSHSISYAKKSYQTAYLKTHILGWFFASWLKNAQDAADSQEEVLELVENARQYELEVLVPDVRTLSTTISSDGLSVRFGLADVKGVGPSQPQKLSEAFPDGFGGWTWPDFLYRAADTVASTAMRAWVGAGAFDWTGVTRTRMGKEFDAWLELTDIEKEWVRSKAPGTTLVEALKSLGRTRKEGGGCSNHKRADLVRSLALMLENQASSDADHPNLLCAMEESYLGVALTCSRVDGCDVSSANVTCGEFLAGKAGHLMLACEVKDVRIIRTKKDGREMAFVTVADRTASLPDVVVFPDTWAKFGRLFRAKNTVLLEGERDYKKGVSFIVNRAIQL
jgi:DNA polymerase-3 subunit alpha